jgi:site-specific DNA-methyltransferase (adenine-specific)
MSRVLMLQGDVREQLARIPAGSVQTCVTSPPYFGLRDYGVEGQIGVEPTPEEFTAALVDVFREVRRTLKDDGTLWVNLGDTYSRGDRGSVPPQRGAAASKNEDKKYGFTSAAGRMGGHPTIKQKDLIGIPWMVAFALRNDGWYLRQDIVWHKPNPMPESITDRCTKAHEYLFLFAKSERYLYDAEAIKERVVGGGDERRNKRSVWSVATTPFKGAHFATFPPALIEPCILAGSRPGDVVLDPFGGAGTTALVASQHGRRSVYIELNPEYVALARARLAGEPAA